MHGSASCSAGKAGACIQACPPAALPLAHVRAFANVRGLVGLHGGRLTIESAPGTGTRVCVRLPIGGVALASQPVKIATFARAPKRGFDTKEPVRLTA